MGKDHRGDAPCMICRKFYSPDPRQAGAQRCCGSKCCRTEYKRQWRERKYRTNAGFREKEKERVERSRETRSGKRPVCDKVTDVQAQVQLLCTAVTQIEATVGGLAAEANHCEDVGALRHVLLDYAKQGKSLLEVECSTEKEEKIRAVTRHVPEVEIELLRDT